MKSFITCQWLEELLKLPRNKFVKYYLVIDVLCCCSCHLFRSHFLLRLFALFFLVIPWEVLGTSPPRQRPRMYNNVPVSWNDRVIESFPDDDFVMHRDPLIQEAIRLHAKTDVENDQYTPTLEWNSRTEYIPTRTFIRLGDMISQNARRTVFSITNTSEYAIIYEHDCYPEFGWSSLVHPLIARIAYIHSVGDIAVTPKTIFISPPAPFRETFKTQFDLTKDQMFQCVVAGATVRYSIISLRVAYPLIRYDQLVRAMHSIPNENEKYTRLFDMGARLVLMIKWLHSRGILHGSLRPKNIVPTRGGKYGKHIHFHLDGFSNAAWINPLTGAANHNQLGQDISRPKDVVWSSPWELQEGVSHSNSRKDELFRIVEIIAQSLSTSPDSRLNMFAEGKLYEYKQFGKLFDMGFLSEIDNVEMLSVSLISASIARIESLVRRNTISPHYDEIAYRLYDIARILKGNSTWSPS